MKKLSLLIALCMLISIGGVYATWTYIDKTDVADESINMAMNLSSVAYAGTYGNYEINTSSLKILVDPKENTTHTTALKIEGEITITFTPNVFAPETVKNNGVASTFQFTLTNNEWKYEGQKILTLVHDDKENIQWTRNGNVFTYTISADDLYEHFQLNEFVLDTKAKYDAFSTALGTGQITISVSDGITSQG